MADARKEALSNRKEASEITEKLMAVRSTRDPSHACRLLAPDPFVPAVSTALPCIGEGGGQRASCWPCWHAGSKSVGH